MCNDKDSREKIKREVWNLLQGVSATGGHTIRNQFECRCERKGQLTFVLSCFFYYVNVIINFFWVNTIEYLSESRKNSHDP